MMHRASWLLGLLFLAPGLALAHGGEDHGEKAIAPLSADHGVVASATGSVFEVVLKSPAITPQTEATVRLLLSDFETNAPVTEAAIDLELKSSSARIFSGKASPTKTAGVYEFSATFPEEGAYSVDLTIQAKGRADLLAVSGFEVKRPEPAADSAAALGAPLLIGGGLGLFASALVLGFALGRRNRKENMITPEEE